jgi:hypothetical protein
MKRIHRVSQVEIFLLELFVVKEIRGTIDGRGFQNNCAAVYLP